MRTPFAVLLCTCCALGAISAPQKPRNDSSGAPTPSRQETIRATREGNAPDGGNTEQSVRIRELPSIIVKRDWIDRISVLCSAALVIVGGVGIGYAIKTLRAVERQAMANEEQLKEIRKQGEVARVNSEAALLTVKATINSERPWMFTEIERLPGTVSLFNVRFTNHGRTPAEIVAFDFHIDCRKSTDDFPATPQYSDEGTVMVSTRMVAPGKSFTPPGEEVISPRANFSPEQWTEIQSSRSRALCWGRLLYRDLIEHPTTIHAAGKDYGSLHETCFCYFLSPLREEFLITGPLSYNRHT
jgi:hypothetical protein